MKLSLLYFVSELYIKLTSFFTHLQILLYSSIENAHAEEIKVYLWPGQNKLPSDSLFIRKGKRNQIV